VGETDRIGRRPGRPSDETAPVITRAELLETAMRMIAARGFNATSIRGLAREAGVTHGTVQHHFPTKQALWEALVDEVLVPRLATSRDQLAAEPGGGLEAVVATRLERAMTSPGLSGAILMDVSDGADERLAYLADATLSMRTGAISQLESLVTGKALRSVNPRALIALDIALACLGSADVALRTFLDIDISDEEQRARLVADISDVILLGVMPRD
jgi:AcrR family transcriptional regulator